MKQLAWAAMCIALVSCVSSKKTTTTNLRKTDSTSTSRATTSTDTASKSSVVTAQDIDIWYNYNDTVPTPAQVALAVAKSRNTKPSDPVFDFVPHQGLESIHVHIGAVTDSSTTSSRQVTIDTVRKQRVIQTALQQTVVEKKTVIPWWIYVAVGVIVLLIILITVYKIVK